MGNIIGLRKPSVINYLLVSWKYGTLPESLIKEHIMDAQFYQDLIGTMNEAVICLNNKFKIEFLNKQASNLFGFKETELTKKAIGSLIKGLENKIKSTIEKNKSLSSTIFQNDLIEIEAKSSEGRQFQVEVSFGNWGYEPDLFYSLIVRDISEQKALLKAQDYLEGRLETDNLRLVEEEKKLVKMQNEMRLAKEVQEHLLPESPPVIEGYDFAAINIPAKEVGGDYYDFVNISGNKLSFCLGDVSGKGMTAALLVANLQATLHSQSLVTEAPEKCVRNANVIIHQNTDCTKFITLFYGVLDTERHHVTYCNAGHDSPIYIASEAEVKNLPADGLPLGILSDYEYLQGDMQFESGATLVLYSDGITEAMNQDEEEFGPDRLTETLKRYRSERAEDLIEKVLSEIREFTGDTPQMDDMTLMIIKRE